ncbi:Stk1 family PASTA domain-containing Ser/Thr kinase [Dactylosporangium aurantiacum]|uniref:non-specific serine/threonine protein kinase n=1 Tax=Dactylosporangium aurantiacum TaxID=35754 RepID=A0A9Q9MNE9_9ACTN|nr:Stk1 family PASTA domain-containing Ser/Thr kinase [Dactylosporangium aurantiacum]MDG6101191.1 Stk1 family PASTA domain-containing Ser/Thr kinase [Dactylosporangium aurantiacum]UWZ59261.1 Stk1 family PASTA domain-containing Ser/Thr kinase [Dactylosporangium aurantiacum]
MTAQPRLLGGRYQVGELLGYGGMAEVHRGRDLRLGRDVAIKTLRTDLARDATFQLRFRREAQNAASLNHPAIVAVYDTGEERGPAGEELPYIVMEFVNGRTLKEVLAAEGRLMPRRALEITADICAALEFSHRHGIIHRDIKPGNVMLTQTGQVKVMDFGIARALASGATTMTQTSAVIGTAQYLSPEQARGEPVDARSDVYASGCVLFELLCGHPPFVGDNPVSVAYQHVREDPRPPSSSNRDVTPEIDAVVLKALAKNPLNRYQSAGEMRADVMRAAAGRPVSAPPVMTEDEMASVMAAQTAYRPPPASRQPARAAQRQKRKNSTGIVVALTVLSLLAVAALSIGLYLANQDPMVQVPDLVGKSQDEARAALRQSKLEGDPRTGPGENCKAGTVISQNPPKGNEVKQGTQVDYNICGEPTLIPIPTLARQQAEAAKQQLANLGLKANIVAKDGAAPKDEVLESDPPAGTPVKPNSTVTLYVSKNNQAIMPDLSNKTLVQAQAALEAAGFTSAPKTSETQVTDPSKEGLVVYQSQPAGRALMKTDVITLRIGVLAGGNPSNSPKPSVTASPNN